MECNILSTALQPILARIKLKKIDRSHVNMPVFNEKRLNQLNRVLICKTPVRCERLRVFRAPRSSEERTSTIEAKNFSMDEESDTDISPNEALERPPTSEELNVLLADSARSKLIKKLSEANQQNRFLKRQLLLKEVELVNFKSELAVIEFEIQAMVSLAKEIANYNIQDGSRKINGKYIQSYLLSRLEAVQVKLEKQIKDVDAVQSKEVPLSWHGLAESVQVMGSFDGWNEGEHLSPEYTGSHTTFSTTLMLRPGRYEIKFLIDGEWQLSSEYPTVGEGLMQNNLLIVD